MTPREVITDEEQREALRVMSAFLNERGYGILALGSSALLLKSGPIGSTKDVDAHVFPVDDVLEFTDALDALVATVGGHWRLEPDGASITLSLRVRQRLVTVEVIEGREDFIQPDVLRDAVETAHRIEGVLVPSWEHLIAMKAEAWFDRTGEGREKFLADLEVIRTRLRDGGVKVRGDELERIVRMRPSRKVTDMLRTVFRVFEDVLTG